MTANSRLYKAQVDSALSSATSSRTPSMRSTDSSTARSSSTYARIPRSCSSKSATLVRASLRRCCRTSSSRAFPRRAPSKARAGSAWRWWKSWFARKLAKDVDSLRTAMAAGALRYIVKPFNFDRFRDALQSYQRFVGRRSSLEAVEQDDVDRLYASFAAPPDQLLPKNLNRPTLDLVVSCLHEQSDSLSALDVADRTGLSRATARRYLEYLESHGRAVLQLRYGAAGRPEHRYRLAAAR